MKLLDKLVFPGIGIFGGAVTGTIDVLTTGLPLLSGYCEASTLSKFQGIGDSKYNPFDIEWKEFAAGQLNYLLGVAIPFGIKYHHEIYSFVNGLVK